MSLAWVVVRGTNLWLGLFLDQGLVQGQLGASSGSSARRASGHPRDLRETTLRLRVLGLSLLPPGAVVSLVRNSLTFQPLRN